jgi:hypothetical protein
VRKLVFLFLLLSSSCFSQDNYKLLTILGDNADFFTTDNQCNVYTVKGSELTKFDKKGKLLYKYSNKKYGNISFVDASNMLRVLVYYRDFSSVVFLDNTLTENADPLNVQTLDLLQVPLVCASYNNGLWFFDQSKFALLHYDKTFRDIIETGNLNQLLSDSLQPNMMLEYNNRLYLNNPRSGILVFDNYGTYLKTIPVKGLSAFQPIGDWVYYAMDKKIKAYNIKTTEEKEFSVLPGFKNFRLETDILVLGDETGISLFSAK